MGTSERWSSFAVLHRATFADSRPAPLPARSAVPYRALESPLAADPRALTVSAQSSVVAHDGVVEQQDARARRRAGREPQAGRSVGLPKEALARAEDQWVHEQAIAVDQVVCGQLLHEHTAAQDGDRARTVRLQVG